LKCQDRVALVSQHALRDAQIRHGVGVVRGKVERALEFHRSRCRLAFREEHEAEIVVQFRRVWMFGERGRKCVAGRIELAF